MQSLIFAKQKILNDKSILFSLLSLSILLVLAKILVFYLIF